MSPQVYETIALLFLPYLPPSLFHWSPLSSRLTVPLSHPMAAETDTTGNSICCQTLQSVGHIQGSFGSYNVIVLRCFFLENFDVAEVWGCPVLTRPGTFTRAAAADCSALAQACICRSQPNLPSWQSLGLSCRAGPHTTYRLFTNKACVTRNATNI